MPRTETPLRLWYVTSREPSYGPYGEVDYDVATVCARTKRDALIAGVREFRRMRVDLDWSENPFAQIRVEPGYRCPHGRWESVECAECEATDYAELDPGA